MKETALKYAEMGYSIIPIRAKSKKPLVDWKRYQTERATPEEIEKWFKEWPDMNIGIITGAISGIAVVDVENGGSLEGLPPTVTAKTGGGGWHLYYRHPGHKVGNEVRTRELTDVRGDGGYVVAPPSVSEKGPYEWSVPPWDSTMEIYPEALFAPQRTATKHHIDSTEKVPVGRRNDEATRYAGRVLHFLPPPLWDTAGWGALKEWNATRTIEPLPEDELRSTYESIKGRESENRRESSEVILIPLTLTELYQKELPAARWIVQDLIPSGGITAVTGTAGSYKSFVSQHLAACVASGEPFLGHFATTKGKVLIVDEENGASLIRDRFKEMGIPPSSDILFLSDFGVKVDNEDHIAKLQEIVERERPVLIIFDSLVRLHSKEENVANEMAGVFSAFKKLLSEDRAIVFIHHHRKPSGTASGSVGLNIRGSTDILAAVHSHLAIDRKQREEAFTVEQGKLRAKKEAKRFLVAVMTDENGHVCLSYQGDDDFDEAEVEELQEKILDILIEASHQPVSTPQFLEKTGARRKDLDDALRKLRFNKKVRKLKNKGQRGAILYELEAKKESQEPVE